MKDRNFLEIFDKIDDKFVLETYKETEKLRRGSKRSFFHAVYTAAACIMVAAAAVLVVSSFIDRNKLVQPSSPGDASQSVTDSNISDSGASDSETSDNDTPDPLVYNNTFYKADNPELVFPEFNVESEDDIAYFYAEFQQQNISAQLMLNVSLNSDYSGDVEKIPTSMYLFTDGQQSLFRHDKANLASLEFDITPGRLAEIDFSFYAGQLTNSVAVVCVFFPGDAARQSCVIRTAYNLSADYMDETMRFELGSLPFMNSDKIQYPNILALNENLHYNSEFADNLLNRLVSEKNEYTSGSPVKNLSVNSAYMYMYCAIDQSLMEEYGYFDSHTYTLIALIDGEPAPVFGGEFSAMVLLDSKEVGYYKLSSEYLSENSSIQIIALPRMRTSNWWGLQSECCLLTE